MAHRPRSFTAPEMRYSRNGFATQYTILPTKQSEESNVEEALLISQNKQRRSQNGMNMTMAPCQSHWMTNYLWSL